MLPDTRCIHDILLLNMGRAVCRILVCKLYFQMKKTHVLLSAHRALVHHKSAVMYAFYTQWLTLRL